MKIFLKIIFTIIAMGVFTSCASDNSEAHVRVVIDADSDSVVNVTGVHEEGAWGLDFTRHLETEFTTSYEMEDVIISCKDRNTCIALKIWVNGNLVCDKKGNSFFTSGYYLQR